FKHLPIWKLRSRESGVSMRRNSQSSEILTERHEMRKASCKHSQKILTLQSIYPQQVRFCKLIPNNHVQQPWLNLCFDPSSDLGITGWSATRGFPIVLFL